jgi:hypothetical protein
VDFSLYENTSVLPELVAGPARSSCWVSKQTVAFAVMGQSAGLERRALKSSVKAFIRTL